MRDWCALTVRWRDSAEWFDELVHSETPLVEAFHELYGIEVKIHSYIDDAFIRKRERIERRRESADYVRIERLVQKVRGQIAQA